MAIKAKEKYRKEQPDIVGREYNGYVEGKRQIAL